VRVDEHTIELASAPVHYRTAPAGALTPVYLHGVPTSSEEWIPLLERTGGVAPDLLGFGRSAKGGHLEYTVPSLAVFVESLIDHLELKRVALVGRQWGALIALELAARTRLERLALIDPLPLTAGHQWGRLAKALRTPLVGELMMGATTKKLLARTLPETANPDSAWRDFDQGTQRAILRLYRATEPDYLTRLRPLDIDALIVGDHTLPQTLLPRARAGDLIEFLAR
jgi:pimeloyl-ACP methyl ester carboxylesterase